VTDMYMTGLEFKLIGICTIKVRYQTGIDIVDPWVKHRISGDCWRDCMNLTGIWRFRAKTRSNPVPDQSVPIP